MFNNMRAKLVALVCFTTVLSCQGETSDEIQRMRKMVVSAAEEVGAHVQKAAHIYGNFDGEGPWCVHFRELADQMSNSWATSANHLFGRDCQNGHGNGYGHLRVAGDGT